MKAKVMNDAMLLHETPQRLPFKSPMKSDSSGAPGWLSRQGVGLLILGSWAQAPHCR